MFKDLLDSGELPQDVYDRVVAEMEVDGKMTMRVYNIYLEELERRRLFSVCGAPYNTKNSAKTDGTYVYKHTKNPFWHIAHAVMATLTKFMGWIGSGIAYGMWRFPRVYKKKFKGIGPCITTSNHVGYLDAVLTRRAHGMRRLHIVVAPHNCKNNFGGALLRAMAVVPLPVSHRGMKPFGEMLEYLRDKGAGIHFYAEKSMWIRYRKPRPYQDGAFFYADKLGVPIVPMLYCFKEPKGLRKLLGLSKATVRVADPVYANAELPTMARRADLAERVDNAVRQLYKDFYGKELEYLPACDACVQEYAEEQPA